MEEETRIKAAMKFRILGLSFQMNLRFTRLVFGSK